MPKQATQCDYFLGISFCSQSGNHPLEDAEKNDNFPYEDLSKIITF